MENSIVIRTIQLADNEEIKNIIQDTLLEYNCAIPGTAFYDKSLQNLFAAYQNNKSVYYVALLNGRIVGGCGISPLENANPNICELQKMYIKPIGRGKKIGKTLLLKCLDFAKKTDYSYCYLESFPHMNSAITLYKKNGFKPIETALGNTGHIACDVRMLLNLSQ